MQPLSVPHLVRRLCDRIAQGAVLDPQQADKLSLRLFDSAFSTLLGLEPVSRC